MFANLLSRYWWVTLLRGVIAIVFGIAVFAQPEISLKTLILLFGVFALADGIANMSSAIGGQEDDENWWVLLVAGLCGIGVGVLTFFNPQITALALLFYIAIWAIATGLLEIVAGVRLRQEIDGEFWLILSGLLSVAFGMFLIARPGNGALAVLWLIGGYAILFGLTLIVLAFREREFLKPVKG
jgi:uncharacterized membrane protein HdeD (DUF308 family)